ncbi:hypothetical protein [Candidatus Poriferisodalis sp.]|uniref:hypothetical protein n=1 Tax=Candidatus Poriferisodalis sp. TaxID=3101277 RepID=UPI003B014849
MSVPDPPRGLEILPEGGADFAGVQESLIERQPSPVPPRLVAGLLLVAALGIAAIAVAWLRGGDELAEAETAPTTTSEPPAATSTTVPSRPPRTTLPPPSELDTPVGDLPPVRPAAELIGTLAADPTDSPPAWLYQLDLVSGKVTFVPVPGLPHTLTELDGVVVVGIRRDVMRVDLASGDLVLLAEDVEQLLPAYSPSGIVAVVRGTEHLFARVVGPDGVFRSAVQLPNEAVVHGALGDHVVVTLAGRVMAVDGRNAALQLGAGRVLAVGPGNVVRLHCEEYGCQVIATAFSATVGVERRDEWCDEICDELAGDSSVDGTSGASAEDCETVCEGYPIATGNIAERYVDLPDELLASSPDRWSEQGLLSPDGGRLAVRLQHGNGSPVGIVVIDLDEEWGRHSPELGVDLGQMAWAPDSRFLLYTLADDVMVWDVEAGPDEVPSGRAHVGEPLEGIILRLP